MSNNIPNEEMGNYIPNEEQDVEYDYPPCEVIQNIITECINAQQAYQDGTVSANHARNIMHWIGIMVVLDGRLFWGDYVYIELGAYLTPMHQKSYSGECPTAEDCNKLQPAIDFLQPILDDLNAGRLNNLGEPTNGNTLEGPA